MLTISKLAWARSRHYGTWKPEQQQVFVKHLDDPDKNIRYSALMALAMMYGKTVPQIPNWQEFDQTPDCYTGLWKAWAQQTGITTTQ